MSEYEVEPIRGLPGMLPPGERILWQGSPQPGVLARGAYHARAVGLYFVALAVAALVLSRGEVAIGVIATVACGSVAVTLLGLLGWAAARTTVYTLTDRRIVLRIGVALPKCVNLPLTHVAAIDLSAHGDIALQLSEVPPLGWMMLWPHARPWRLARPEPMLRNLADAQAVATQIARACLAVQPDGRLAARPAPAIADRPLADALAA